VEGLSANLPSFDVADGYSVVDLKKGHKYKYIREKMFDPKIKS
jgi:hypothetical protein